MKHIAQMVYDDTNDSLTAVVATEEGEIVVWSVTTSEAQ